MKYDCVIIGSGVAGLTASLYLARAKKSVIIIENSILGGTSATLENIENYPGFESVTGIELVQNMIAQVTKLGVIIDFMNISYIDFDNKIIKSDNAQIQFSTLIIASGTSYNKLNLSEEELFRFKGLSYCAVCDGTLYRNKKIVVVTNGKSGLSTVNYLMNISNDITVLDISDSFANQNPNVYHNVNVKKINGKNIIESIDFTINGGENKNIQCDGLFVALGKSTDLSLYTAINKKDGFILTDENMHTNLNGVFCAGDIRYKNLRQIITACSDGAIAGVEAIKFLQKN